MSAPRAVAGAGAARPAAPAGDVFARATLRLAALFAVIVVLLIVVSGVVLYWAVSSDIQRVIASGPVTGESEQDRVNQSVTRLRWQLVIVDGIAIIAVGGVGLWYARRTLRPIRETYAAQKRFVADASHELRTPLAVMQAEFEVALRGREQGAAARPVLESGLEEVGRMSAIVDDLLMLSRIDAHQEELSLTTLDLAALAGAAVDGLRALADQSGVTLAFDAQGAPAVNGDAPHLERAVRNVVKNAVEASPRGGTVSVTVEAGRGEARVAVTDPGPGIAPADRERVFERFYRADAARPRAGGSGLGLAIVRWTVDSHDGDVRVAASEGDGTTVVITLPLAAGV